MTAYGRIPAGRRASGVTGSNSLLKSWEMGGGVRCFCGLAVQTVWLGAGAGHGGRTSGSGGDEFGDADEVAGDQVEHEVAADPFDAAVFGLAHRAMLLAPAENAFDRFAAGLGDRVSPSSRNRLSMRRLNRRHARAAADA
jgi:hypothetical protein